MVSRLDSLFYDSSKTCGIPVREVEEAGIPVNRKPGNLGLVSRDTFIGSLLAVVLCHVTAFGQSNFTFHFDLYDYFSSLKGLSLYVTTIKETEIMKRVCCFV